METIQTKDVAQRLLVVTWKFRKFQQWMGLLRKADDGRNVCIGKYLYTVILLWYYHNLQLRSVQVRKSFSNYSYEWMDLGGCE